MRVTVNLASRPFADLVPAMKRLRLGMGILALVAIALGVGLHLLGSRAEATRARERVLDSSIARVSQERQSYQNMVHQPENAAVLTQVSELNKLIDVKAFSWTLAIEDLETVLPAGVQVTTLEPSVDKKDGHITVRMRVVGPRDKAVELVENLEHSRRFLQPRIVGETSETTGNGPQQQLEPVSASNRVSFELLADYNPAAPGERRKAGSARVRQTAEDLQSTPSAARRMRQPGLSRAPYANPAQPQRAIRNPGGPQ